MRSTSRPRLLEQEVRNIADEHKLVPPPITGSGERIQSRDHAGDFARLPADETHPLTEPGAGPHGAVGAALNVPLLVVFAGLGLAYATFLVGHWATLVAGFVLVVVGAGWQVLRHRPVKLYRGVGTVKRPAR